VRETGTLGSVLRRPVLKGIESEQQGSVADETDDGTSTSVER